MAATAPRDFGFGEDEQLLRDLARRFLDENLPIERLRALVAADHESAYERGERPGWDEGLWKQITELGWPVYGSVDEAVQARFLVRSTLLAVRAGAEGVFWYTLRDGPRPQDFPPEDAFGLLHPDTPPKPAYPP